MTADVEFEIGHAGGDNCPDRCILCSLQLGLCPWCGANGDCEHADQGDA